MYLKVDGVPPRVCGKYYRMGRAPRESVGSPPRMREIPAQYRLRARRIWDHPRACGKYSPLSAQDADELRITPAYAGNTSRKIACEREFLGSPPRMREKPLKSFLVGAYVGITPAHAGKTALDLKVTRDTGDHPRACGKNVVYYILAALFMGSPPPRAGKTLFILLPVGVREDHPRACGKNDTRERCDRHALGSPPRVREKRAFFVSAKAPMRITPARAGKTRNAYVIDDAN